MAKRLEIHGGKIVSDSYVGAAEGTTIKVRNLFYNTPARRKFLKKPATEGAQISDIVNRIILARPDIGFKYVVNGTQSVNTAEGGNLQMAALSVYGKEVAKNLIAIDEKIEGLEISGFLGKPEISRGKRAFGSIFINGRYIKSQILERAIEEAYKNRLTVGKFPTYILNLKLDPTLVDVNVHPQKLEVRFSDERAIYNLFYDVASEALRNEVLIPEITVPSSAAKLRPDVLRSDDTSWTQDQLQRPTPETPPGTHTDKLKDSRLPPRPMPREDKSSGRYSVNMSNMISSLFGDDDDADQPLAVNEALPAQSYNYYEQNQEAEVSHEVKPAAPVPFFHNYSIVGQFLATYWLIEQHEAIYLIDQHAAHERVVFERLIKEYKDSRIISQRLVDPMIVEISDKESVTINDNSRLFSRFGYDLEALGTGEYAVKSVPIILGEATNVSLFMQILDKLSENPESVSNIFDEKLASIATIACKAAVKANDRIHITEARALIEELLKLENPFNCPHGRPTIVKLTKTEIEKMFKRIQ